MVIGKSEKDRLTYKIKQHLWAKTEHLIYTLVNSFSIDEVEKNIWEPIGSSVVNINEVDWYEYR